MHLQITENVAIITGSSRGLGLAAARALAGEGCRVVICARGAEALKSAAAELETAAGRGGARARDRRRCLDAGGRGGRRRRRHRAVRPPRHSGQQRRQGRRRRHRLDAGRRVAERDRSDAVSGDSHVAPRRAAHAPRRRRRDCHDRVDLGPRVGRPHDLQRRQGRRDQPRQGDGAAAREGQHPRQQRGARARSSSRAAAGGSASRKIRKASPSSSGASCHSAASAAPTKSARRRVSRIAHARAGSPAPASPSTAASRARTSDESCADLANF